MNRVVKIVYNATSNFMDVISSTIWSVVPVNDTLGQGMQLIGDNVRVGIITVPQIVGHFPGHTEITDVYMRLIYRSTYDSDIAKAANSISTNTANRISRVLDTSASVLTVQLAYGYKDHIDVSANAMRIDFTLRSN